MVATESGGYFLEMNGNVHGLFVNGQMFIARNGLKNPDTPSKDQITQITQ